MAHVLIKDGRSRSKPAGKAKPPCRSPDSIKYALRDSQGRLLAGDAQLPAVADDQRDQPAARHGAARRPQRAHAHDAIRYARRSHHHYGGGYKARNRAGGALRLHEHAALGFRAARHHAGAGVGRHPAWPAPDQKTARRDRRALAARLAAHRRTSVPREIAPVVVTLNRLFDMLRTSVQSQQQFIANTAHQLRTPITGMQAQLDLLAAEPAAQPIKARLLTLQEGIRQLAHSANQLLTLARADPAANIAAKNQTVDAAGHRRRGRRQILRPRPAIQHRPGSRGVTRHASTRIPRCSTIY